LTGSFRNRASVWQVGHFSTWDLSRQRGFIPTVVNAIFGKLRNTEVGFRFRVSLTGQDLNPGMGKRLSLLQIVRLALWPSQPLIQCVPVSIPGGKAVEAWS
jgi:hypothetical protein